MNEAAQEIIRITREEGERQRKILEELGTACAVVGKLAKKPRPELWSWQKPMRDNLAKIYDLCAQTNLTSTERREDGHLFRWQPKIGAWQTTSGQVVLVYPPNKISVAWKTITPATKEENSFVGDFAQERAFLVAVMRSRQKS